MWVQSEKDVEEVDDVTCRSDLQSLCLYPLTKPDSTTLFISILLPILPQDRQTAEFRLDIETAPLDLPTRTTE